MTSCAHARGRPAVQLKGLRPLIARHSPPPTARLQPASHGKRSMPFNKARRSSIYMVHTSRWMAPGSRCMRRWLVPGGVRWACVSHLLPAGVMQALMEQPMGPLARSSRAARARIRAAALDAPHARLHASRYQGPSYGRDPALAALPSIWARNQRGAAGRGPAQPPSPVGLEDGTGPRPRPTRGG
jgi:hypothetical protein